MSTVHDREDLRWLRQISSFASSRIILTANNFHIFDHLAGAGASAATLARRIKTDTRATELLLNSLAALGLLGKVGSTFRNRPVASRYLVSKSPLYQGNILRHYHALWNNWSGLDAVVKTGQPNRVGRDLRSFILGMHDLAKLKVRDVLSAIDLKGVRRSLDLGGGPGTYTIGLAEKGIDATLMDFPETLEISREVVGTSRAKGRISFLAGDFVTDDIGSGYDLILISQIFHAYASADCFAMLKKCRRALNPGGRVVIQEFLLDESRTSPPWGAIFSINMLVNTPGGRTYTPREMTEWLKKAGFRKMKKTVLGETVLITGWK